MALGLWGCAAEKKNLFSKTYHNTTAHYNAYFIAEEDLEKVKQAVEDSYDRDFNKILKIFPDIDSATVQSQKDNLEDCIIKASLAIQRHPNSRWVDHSYVLVGKARFYLAEFSDAIETFKYVNTKGKSDDARHDALVSLMRTFIHNNEHNNAIAVFDFLKKEELNDDNLRQMYLTLAYLFQLRNDYNNAAKMLAEAIPLSKKKDHIARQHFILAQIYQEKGRDTLSYEHYRSCVKKNPDYEMSFYAKLYMAQVSPTTGSNVKRIRRYFKKLLRDEKNIEYRDKIYYEMAGFELKQDDYDLAVDHLKSSVRESTQNMRQKAYSYLKLGELYYEHFKNYELAKDYYDSTVSVLPKEDERYEQIAERHQILVEFVEQIVTIRVQDSLLNLATMNPEALSQLLDEEVARKKRTLDDEAQAQRKAERKAAGGGANMMQNPFDQDGGNFGEQEEGGTWYFYNNAATSSGRSEFARKWGKRTLEDNWRRSRRESSAEFAVADNPDSLDEEMVSADRKKGEPDAPEFDFEAEREALMNTIPFDEEAKTLALGKIELAYYNLGNIYNFKLLEKENSIESFKILISRFPKTEHYPEALYQLYLIYTALDDKDSAQFYANELQRLFPDSLYAKLIENPNYLADLDATGERLKRLYKIAYDFYDVGNLNESLMLVERAIQEYPDNDFSDNLELLKILIIGKMEGIYKYQFLLQEFIKDNEESELLEHATALLETSRKYQEKEEKQKGIKFIKEFDHEHYFVAVFNNRNNIAAKVSEKINDFSEKKFPQKELKTGSLILNDNQSLVMVNAFINKKEAQEYLKALNGNDNPLLSFESVNFDTFVISRENFQVLFQTKELSAYLDFYKENYL